MNETQRAKKILKILNKIYPKITVPLKSRNIFTLLISVLLSAQCTDVNVNNVTNVGIVQLPMRKKNGRKVTMIMGDDSVNLNGDNQWKSTEVKAARSAKSELD